MSDLAKHARATAEGYRMLAEISSPANRTAYLTMAEWWENRAEQLELAQQMGSAANSNSDIKH